MLVFSPVVLSPHFSGYVCLNDVGICLKRSLENEFEAKHAILFQTCHLVPKSFYFASASCVGTLEIWGCLSPI